MRIAAGIVGILVGIFSLFYIGLFGGLLGSATSWLGSGPWSHGDSTVTNLGQMITLLSYLSGLLAIVGGIVAFSNTRLGGIILAASAFSHWYLLGFGIIGKIFVLPMSAAATFAFFAARSGLKTVSSGSSVGTSDQRSSNESTTAASFDRTKWNALLQYDKDIAAVAERLTPLGSQWIDELGLSYLSLNDKTYLPEIEKRITLAAKAEEDRQKLAIEEEGRLAQERKDQEDRLAMARKVRNERWREQFWGSKAKKLVTSGAGVAILVAIGASVMFATAPPARPTKSVVWSGSPDNYCSKLDCLREQMQKSGANSGAIRFAETLTANLGTVVWADGLKNFGPVDLVSYMDFSNHPGGYVLLDRDLAVIKLDRVNLEEAIFRNTRLASQHPQMMAVMPYFSGVTELEKGERIFVFQYAVTDCMACAPIAALTVAYEFDRDGRLTSASPTLVRAWSDRLPSERIN